jgi:hypothetical protein
MKGLLRRDTPISEGKIWLVLVMFQLEKIKEIPRGNTLYGIQPNEYSD